MVTSLEYRHAPTGTLAILAQRLGKVYASPSTWYHLVRKYGWRRPRLRVHPAKPKVGVRTTRANEMWHIDTTVIRLLDGAYLHAVIDNFSLRILAWRVRASLPEAKVGGTVRRSASAHDLLLATVPESPTVLPGSVGTSACPTCAARARRRPSLTMVTLVLPSDIVCP
jgi:hypothetical protein